MHLARNLFPCSSALFPICATFFSVVGLSFFLSSFLSFFLCLFLSFFLCFFLSLYLSDFISLNRNFVFIFHCIGYPDISLLGVKYIVSINGSFYPLDGTSASCPVAASMVSLVNSARLASGRSTLGEKLIRRNESERENGTMRERERWRESERRER